MNCNGEVEHHGDSHYFTNDTARTVSNVVLKSNIAMAFLSSSALLGKPRNFTAAHGDATLIRDKAAFAERWLASLDR